MKYAKDFEALKLWANKLHSTYERNSNKYMYQILMTGAALLGDEGKAIVFVNNLNDPLLRASSYIGIAHGMLGEESRLLLTREN